MKRTSWKFCLGLAAVFPVMLAGCSDSDVTPSGGVNTSIAELSATVGPQGGTIAGARDTMFAGVRLEIPPGALATPTRVTITTTYDGTPLPVAAERVGVQFHFEPAGTVLAQPAHLTLPVDVSMVQRFGQTASDAKVWVRSGDVWMLRAPTATDEGSVTIDLTAFTTAAAGVRLTAIPSFCLVNPTICEALPPTCLSTTGFCVTSLGTPSVRPVIPYGFETDGSGLYYGALSGSTATIARFDLVSHVVTQSQPIGNAGPAIQFPHALALDKDGSVWTGMLFLGNAQFRFGAASQLFDPGNVRNGLGAVITTDGSLARLTARDRVDRIGGQFNNPFAWPSDAFLTSANTAGAVPDQTSARGYWFPLTFNVLGQYVAGNPGFIRRVLLPAGHTMDPSAPMASAPDGTIVVQGSRLEALRLRPNSGNVMSEIPGLGPLEPGVRDVAFDRLNTLWVTPQRSNEIFVLDSAGVLKSIQLTTAQLPVGIRTLPDNSALVMTAAREILRIRRNGTR